MIVRHNISACRAIGTVLLFALASYPAFAHQALSTEPVVISAAQVTVTGTVTELTVKNQVTGVTLRYFGLKLDQGGSYALTGTILDTLSNGSRINATGTLVGNLFNVSLFSVVAQTQSLGRVTTLAETKKTVSGTLAVFHKDFFEEGRGEYGLAVRDASDKPTQLNVAAIPDSLAIGMLISAEGKAAADGTSLDASTITILAPPLAKTGDIAAAPITNNVLVLPIKFTDTGGEPFSVAAIDTEFQTRVAPYYQEVSYGQQLLNVTVANSGGNWLSAGQAAPGCDYTTIGNLADAAATAAGYNINSYQNRYYVMPSIGCGWAGLAYVGWGRAWSNGVNALWVYGHELGHNFGLWHAGSVSCGAQVLGGSCSVSEYGDPFDVMGNIRQMHFNAMQKNALHWIPSTSVKTHSSGSQTYYLSPLETGGQSTYAVKIPTSNVNRTYWVEFRQPIGFDSPLSTLPNLGAQIRVGGPKFDYYSCSGGGCGDDTELLDMTPGSGGFDNAALMQGQSYIDVTTGVAINVISATSGPSGLLTVSVAMGGKISSSTTLTSSGSPSVLGATVTFTATVAGGAPTGTITFNDGGNTISGCGAVSFTGGSTNAPTAVCSTSGLSVATHSILAIYSGDAGNNGSASATLSQVVNNVSKLPSSTLLSSSANPADRGTAVALIAAVTATTPSGTVTFTDGGTVLCSTVAVVGTTALCNTSLGVGAHSLVATYSGNASTFGSTSAALLQKINPAGMTNLALASAGATASASSTLGAGYPASAIINDDRAGTNWGNGGGWNDGDTTFPDWAEIAFNGNKTIDRVFVYSVQDNYTSPIEPTDTLTFSLYGVTDFTVQGWTGAAWVTLATVSGNNQVRRKVNFAPTTVSRIRINISNALGSYSRLTEVEAYGTNAATPASLVNSNFEFPALGSSFQYTPSASGIGWTFSPATGIQGNGSAWGAAPAPTGTQTAFIQQTGSIAQTISLNAGSYTLSFQAAQRLCCVSPFVQPVKVSVDGIQIGSLISPASTSFATYNIPFSVGTSGVHTFTFAGTDTNDKTTFIDNVNIQ